MKLFRAVRGLPLRLRFDRYPWDRALSGEGSSWTFGKLLVLADGEIEPLLEIDLYGDANTNGGVLGYLSEDDSAALAAGMYWLKATYYTNGGLRSEAAKLEVALAVGEAGGSEPGEVIESGGWWTDHAFSDLGLLLDRWAMANCPLADGRVFCFGGRGVDAHFDEVLLLDPAARTTELVAVAGSQPPARYAASCCELDGYVYLLGGAMWNGSNYTKPGDFWRFDLSVGVWEQLAGSGTPSYYQQRSPMVAWGGAIYVFPQALGVDISHIGINRYEPDTGDWFGAFERPPIDSVEVGVLVGDYWYFVGGNQCCRLDMSSGDYEMGPTLAGPGVYGGALAYSGGAIYLVAGLDNDSENGLDHSTRVLRLEWDQSRWVRLVASNEAPGPSRVDALLFADDDSGWWLVGGERGLDFWSPELVDDYVHWVVANED